MSGTTHPTARIAFICEGDAESSDRAFSGIAYQLVEHLRRLGHIVAPIDAELYGLRRAAAAVCSFTLGRTVWRVRYRLGRTGFVARSRKAAAEFERVRHCTDVILQIGATFETPSVRIPYVLYCDWNAALAIRHRDNPLSPYHAISPAEAAAIDRRQAAVYRGAAAIFCISERLRVSFLTDYGLPAERILTVYAGSNIEADRIPPRESVRPTGRPPTILFSGKEFRRKGGDVMLAAFARLRQEFPDARLWIAGPRSLETDQPGVEVLGYLSKDDPAQFDRLVRRYAEADVFCLPTRYDPFPTVIREAMAFGLPCVATDFFAMSEMVVDGKTGYTIAPDDIDALVDRLGILLRDPTLAAAMGQAGRRRSESLFTWDRTVRLMHDRIEQLIPGA